MPFSNQIQIFKDKTDNFISEDLLIEKLKEDRPLKIKFGIDPTATDLHLGHLVLINKLKQLQKLGHEIHIVIGDTTAQIGDPTGKNKKRIQLSHSDVLHNSSLILNQLYKILDKNLITVHFNSEWFNNFTLKDILLILSSTTIQQITERRDFKNRIKNEEPLFLNEVFYPLMQGYDSIQLKADVEIGGSDQLLNILMGRDLQSKFNQKSQIVLTLPILEGTDGKEKMSKSLGNYISLNETPTDFFGKIMSIPDSMIMKYFDLLVISDSNFELLTIQILFEKNPMLAKKYLGEALLTQIFPDIISSQIIEDFNNKFSKKDLSNIKYEKYVFNPNTDEKLLKLILNTKAVDSLTQARNLLKQGAIKINNQKIFDMEFRIPTKNFHLIVGKKKFFEIIMDKN